MGNIKTYLQFISFLHAGMTQIVEILPHVKQELTFLHRQYHGCWCPGDARSQVISNHYIDYVEPELFGPCMLRVNLELGGARMLPLQQPDCLLNILYRLTKKSSQIVALHHRSFVKGIHRCPVDSPYKWPVTRKEGHDFLPVGDWPCNPPMVPPGTWYWLPGSRHGWRSRFSGRPWPPQAGW